MTISLIPFDSCYPNPFTHLSCSSALCKHLAFPEFLLDTKIINVLKNVKFPEYLLFFHNWGHKKRKLRTLEPKAMEKFSPTITLPGRAWVGEDYL